MTDKCLYYAECANSGKSCFKCFNYNFYKPIKQPKSLMQRSLNKKQKKKGIDFENRGVKKYNQTIDRAKRAARRQIASGALHFALGDMITEEELTAALAEFKSTVSPKGEKQITIKKEWLDKLKEEAQLMNRDYYFLPISFKNSETDYVVMEYDMLLSYIQTIQFLHEKIQISKRRNES